MVEGFRLWANPSSPHAEGRKARAALEGARERIKAALGWNGELIFTSGASEAAALAMNHAVGGVRDGLAVEHDALIRFIDEEGIIDVGSNGSVDFDALERHCTRAEILPEAPENRPLIALQHVNSETGARQDIGKAVEIARNNGATLLVDCAQSAGKYTLPECDMAIVSAHKFGGPIGIGALLVRDYAMLHPTGGHERGYRPGTENLPAALGMAAALEACSAPYVDPQVLEPLDVLGDECRKLDGTWLSDQLANPTPYIHAIAMSGISGSAQVMRFDLAGIAVSQGSACSSGTMKPSRVLEAMGIDPDIAARTIRVSLGWNTTREEVERFCETWLEMARRG